MTRRTTILILVACTLSFSLVSPAAAVRITLLHTNDTHGHLHPFSYPEGQTGSRTLDSLRVRRNIGGIARRATLAREIREEAAAQGDAVLLIDAGDFCDGTPFSTEYHGEADLAAIREAGYDFATFGNHELNNSPAQVRRFATESRARGARLRFLSANLLDVDGLPLAAPYALFDLDSVRVGMFGLTTEEAAGYPAARQGLQVLPVIPTAEGIASTLRRMGADLVVLISHCGEEVDRELAGVAPALDVIIGGHSHSRLPAGEFFRPFQASPADSNGTIIVQAHQWGGELGRLDLDLERGPDGRWVILGRNARLLPITAEVSSDPRVAAVVDSFWAPISTKYGEVVGQAQADFSSRRRKDGSWDQANYNFVADAIRETFGTQIEMENQGGVRAPLVRGPITLTDLVTMDPFDNTVVTYRITGRDLKRILLEERPGVSGLTYRIVRGELTEVKVNGKPVADDAVYTGASNSYFARGALRGIEVTDTRRPRLEVLRAYVQSKGTITPKYDGRRIVEGD